MKKFKNSVSALLTAAICISGTVVPVSAEIGSYDDFVTPVKEENLIPDASMGGGSTYFSARNNGAIDASNYYTTDQGNDGYSVKWSYTGSDPLTLAWGVRNYFDGIEINSQGGNFGFVPEGGKNYVFSANLKNASPEGIVPHVGVSMVDGNWNKYTIEGYGSGGMELDSDWKKLEGVIKMPADWTDSAYSNAIYFGFPAGTLPGAAFWLDVSGKDSVYFAEEQVYEFSNVLNKDIVSDGQTITATAQLKNQLGITGGLEQDFDWRLLNADRSQEILSGYTIVESENNADVIINGLPGGEYTLLAVAYDGGQEIYQGVSFAVESAAKYSDYIFSKEMPQNLIPSVSAGCGSIYLGARNDSNIDNGDFWTPGITGYSFKYSYTGSGDYVLNDKWRGFGGFELNSQGGAFGFIPEGGKTYVLSAYLKNESVDGVTPHFGVAANGTYGPSSLVYTNEYGAAGMPVGEDWTNFKASISYPIDYTDATGFGNKIMCGFPDGTKEGSSVRIDVSDDNAFYFAEEQIYDMDVAADTVTVKKGKSFNAEAAIVNQLGIVGGLKQDFDWFVVDNGRNSKVDGFTFEKNQNSVKVNVGEDVTEGDYVLIAQSDDNEEIIKGIEFSVVEAINYADKKGVKPQNLIPDVTSGGGSVYLGARNDSNVDNGNFWSPGVTGYSFKYSYTGTGDYSLGTPWRAFGGFELNSQGGAFGFEPEPGKTYVVSATLKNASENNVTPYFGIAMNDAYGLGYVTSNEYGLQGMPIGDNWTKFNATITLPNDYRPEQTAYAKMIFCGFPSGTKEGSAFWIDISDNDAFYLAEEKAYESTIELSAQEVMINSGLSANAELLNQVGIKGTLDQEFDWFVTDKTRSEIVDGFDITAFENGAFIKPSENVIPDEYVLIAQSKADSKIRKGMTFSVLPEGSYIDYVPGAKYENLIPDATEGGGQSYFTTRNSSPIDNRNFYSPGITAGGYSFEYYYGGTGDYTVGDLWRGFGGFELNGANGAGKGEFDFMPVPGKTYVISANLKNSSAGNVTPYFGAAMNDAYGLSLVTTNEYGSQGMPVGNDWTPFNATITIPDDYRPEQTPFAKRIFCGFPSGTKEGSAYYIDVSAKDSFYFAEEQLYDITVTADKTTSVLKEDAQPVTFNAAVVNQIGLTSSFDQNFRWVLLDKYNKVIDNAPLSVTNNTKSAILDMSALNVGTYKVAATSVDYEGFVRTYTVNILNQIENIYVSADGNDNNSGDEDAPLKTINGAITKVRELKRIYPNCDIDVIFAGGEYYISDTVNFTSADSNSYDNKVTYKAADGEEVIFKGSVTLDLNNASDITDEAVKSRLKSDVCDKVVEIDLSNVDLSNNGTISPTIQYLYKGHEYFGLFLNGN